MDESTQKKGLMEKIVHFVKYNNLFTVVIIFVVLGSGVSLAASPAVRDDIISKTETVKSIDNTYILVANLNNLKFGLKINNVIEDQDNYYIEYSYKTISLSDYVWKDMVIQKKLTVNKKSIEGKDLGLFVASELGQVIDSELAYLKDVQRIEREKGSTLKTVSVAYAGLIGSMLGTREKVFEGYKPVVAPKGPEPDKHSGAVLADESTTGRSQSIPKVVEDKKQDIKEMLNDVLVEQNLADEETPPADPIIVEENPPEEKASSTPSVVVEDTEAPVITLLGNNPEVIQAKTIYADPGATASDNIDENVAVQSDTNNINTSLVGNYEVIYTATDKSGNISTLKRVVQVMAQSGGGDTTNFASTTTPTDPITPEVPVVPPTTPETPAPETPPVETETASTTPEAPAPPVSETPAP